MNPLASCIFKIDFEFVSIDHSSMAVELRIDDFISRIQPDSDGIFVFERSITLPKRVQMIFSGKNMMSDTIIDDQGKILRDKCVIIKQVSLDGFTIDRSYLEKRLALEIAPSGEICRSNYIGHNGTMYLDLAANVFFQMTQMDHEGKVA